MTELPPETPEGRLEPEPDPVLTWSRQKFYLTANLALAAVSIALLKFEGPWYVDGIVAAFFLVAFCFALTSRRAIGPKSAGRWFLLILAAFHLAACITIVWLTFISPLEVSPGDEQNIVASQQV